MEAYQPEVPYPQNGILRLYNQFPSMYANLGEMAADLARIAAMNFNAVWINPLHPSSRKQVQRGRDSVSASYYAAIDFNSIDALIGDLDLLHRWVNAALEADLIPIFDLVLKHVGNGINFADQKLKEEWLKPYNKESQMNDVVDFIYSYNENENPAQSRVNEEETEIAWKEIFESFWKPYIYRWLNMGFRGVRIDAVRFLPPYVLKDVCEHVRAINPQAVIFGELLYEKNIEPLVTLLTEQKVQITHITNSLYWTNFSPDMRTVYFSNKKGTSPKMLGNLNAVTHDGDNRYGGSVGFGGSHDENSLFTSCKKNLVRVKQKIASVAFTSTGGWFLICGDEFGFERKKNKPPFAFKFLKNKPFKISFNTWHTPGTERDITEFIREINSVLAKLPRTTAHDWIEHIVLEPHSGLVIMLKNINLDAAARLIIANSENESVIIDEKILEAIALEFEKVQYLKPTPKDAGFFSYLENAKKTIMGLKHSPEKIFTIGRLENRFLNLSPHALHPK